MKNNYTSEFEAFWSAYPPRYHEYTNKWIKSDKAGAFKEWLKLSREDRQQAVGATSGVEKGKYTPDARKWLYHRRWEDEVVVVSNATETRNCCVCGKIKDKKKMAYSSKRKESGSFKVLSIDWYCSEECEKKDLG